MTQPASRILLVEDDPEQAELFALILSDYEVIIAPDAESALVRLVETPFALLLVDWDLPGMKGDALITTVKAHYPDTRTILFSNHSHVDMVAATCGADSWYHKMDSTAHLRRLVADLLRQQVNCR